MKKLVAFLALAVSAAAFSIGSASATTKTVTVSMRDPGCHWFLVGSKYETKLTVSGPVSLYNLDEAALKIAGAKGITLEKVGAKLAFGRGVYHITMVGQASDDNHLLLTVK